MLRFAFIVKRFRVFRAATDTNSRFFSASSKTILLLQVMNSHLKTNNPSHSILFLNYDDYSTIGFVFYRHFQ
jgi:hypothetical protein